VPSALLHPIIKPWPFRGWGLDFIGKIHSPLAKGHCFVIVATDYFTNWTEAIPLKNMTQGGDWVYYGAYYTLIWHSTNFNYGSRYFIYG
jgi:hypothetical protein